MCRNGSATHTQISPERANDYVGVTATPGVTRRPAHSPVDNSIHPQAAAKCITNTDRGAITDASESLN